MDGRTDGRADGRTDGQMDVQLDGPSFREARMHVERVGLQQRTSKRFFNSSFIELRPHLQ